MLQKLLIAYGISESTSIINSTTIQLNWFATND